MSVRGYFRRYLSDYLYAIAFVLAVSFLLGQGDAAVFARQSPSPAAVIVLDPGHGGSDGGTQSAAGVPESHLNLEISQRVYDLLGLVGIDRVMTRQTDISLDTEGETVRQRKQSDLRNRVRLVNERENAVLVSIHQNYFDQSRYRGPQVFYAQTRGSEALAQQMQTALNTFLAPESGRSHKPAQGIYLMERIERPGILIECGFLSNEQEARLLTNADYQKKLACVITGVMAQNLTASTGVA